MNSSKLKPKLFALINSVLELEDKYQKGKISDSFFHKTLKSSMDSLMEIKIKLKESDISIVDLVKQMGIKQRYDKSLSIMDEVILSQEAPPSSQARFKTSVLELPSQTSQITSAFITLMDALQLDKIRDASYIHALFDDLKEALARVPMLNPILAKVNQVHAHALDHSEMILNSRSYKKKACDHLFAIFKQFEDALR